MIVNVLALAGFYLFVGSTARHGELLKDITVSAIARKREEKTEISEIAAPPLSKESQAPPESEPPRKEIKEITFDPSYGSINSPSQGRSRDSQLI